MEELLKKLENELLGIVPAFRPLRPLAVGAEAALFLGEMHGMRVVAKYRYPKEYRVTELDVELRRRRTIREAKLLSRALESGVSVPAPLFVEEDSGVLVMEYVEGPRLKEVLDELGPDVSKVFRRLGVYVGRLHEAGIVHGDLTTSNVIMTAGGPVLIDFGLGDFTREDEARGVDLHLFLRALESTHPMLARSLFEELLEGYAEVRGVEARREMEEKVREIRMRGRYVAERRRKTLKSVRSVWEGHEEE